MGGVSQMFYKVVQGFCHTIGECDAYILAVLVALAHRGFDNPLMLIPAHFEPPGKSVRLMCLNIHIRFKYCACGIFSQVTTAPDASDFWSRAEIHRQSDECLIHEANFIEELRSKYPFTIHVVLLTGSASTVGRPEIVGVQVPHAAIDADHLPGNEV